MRRMVRRKTERWNGARRTLPLLFFLTVLLLTACAPQETGAIRIAVMGDPDAFYPGYQEGVERAVRDLNREYGDSGWSVTCTFAGGGSYEDSAAIVSQLSGDRSLTAVIGDVEMDVNKTAAEVCERNGKLMVVPYYLNDSVLGENNYRLVFSMCNSGRYVGQALRCAANDLGRTRWAVCAENREFELDEANGFICPGWSDDVEVVDCVNISALEQDFDQIYERWEVLGVEGVMLFPEDREGFPLLKELKRRNPELLCGGDTAFDNSTLLKDDPELMGMMEGFILADEFTFEVGTKEEADRILEMAEEYQAQTGRVFDSWYVQGYNAVQMIAGTAIRHETMDPEEIAAHLRVEGYDGLAQQLRFQESGARDEGAYYFFNIYTAEGSAEPYWSVPPGQEGPADMETAESGPQDDVQNDTRDSDPQDGLQEKA